MPDSVAFIRFPWNLAGTSRNPAGYQQDVQLCHFISPNLSIYFNLWLKMHVRKPDHETIRKLELLALSLVSHLSAFDAANGPVLVPKPVICAYLPATGQILGHNYLVHCTFRTVFGASTATKLAHLHQPMAWAWPILRFSISPWTTSFFPNRFRVPNLEHLDVILEKKFQNRPTKC